MSTIEDEISARVERVLSGKRRSDDLLKTVLWLRFQCAGSVKELGHFLAHFDAKDRGAPTKEMTNYFLYMKTFLGSRDESAITPEHIMGVFKFDDMSPDFRAGLTARFQNVKGIELYKTTGIPITEAPRILETALSKAELKKNGKYTLKGKCTNEEVKLLQGMMGNFGDRHILNADEVFKEFVSALAENGVVDANDPRIQSVKEFYSLFVAVSLNNSKLNMGGIEADLELLVIEGKVKVMARAIIYTSVKGGHIFHVAPIYWTDIMAESVMDGQTQAHLSDLKIPHRPVEIDEFGRLVLI
ncbi:hypothetical protein [Methylobacterium sp. Leaf85]|uniref:hypothetical protein n=1 Tax=Methylobacterium sp. Leaf85 TaxID=1736241 RepID=UPI000AA0B2DC|nr:hypothetical protein [Methylobacterium sp. Leaf85]